MRVLYKIIMQEDVVLRIKAHYDKFEHKVKDLGN